MELPAHKASISCATAADRLTTLLLGTVRPDGPGPLTLDDQKLAAFGSEVASRLPFRGVGVNVLDAGLLTPPLAPEESFEMASIPHGKQRKVIEIKRDALLTRRGRL